MRIHYLNLLDNIGFNVFLPQEDSNNVHDRTNRQKIIFNKNLAGIKKSDILVAVIGLRTDFRTLGIEGTVNLMIERSVILCMSISELLNHLKSMKEA
jgi:hypothetical protein